MQNIILYINIYKQYRHLVVEDVLVLCQPILGVGLHHIRTKHKSIVTNQEVRDVCVIVE